MQGQVRLYPEPLRSIAAGSISGSYNTIGSGFAHPIYIIHLVNDTDVALVFSFDGTTDHLYLPSSGFLVLDITTNRAGSSAGLYFSVGQRIWVAEAVGAPTTGIVTLSAFFAE
jgi:hypothetical protein